MVATDTTSTNGAVFKGQGANALPAFEDILISEAPNVRRIIKDWLSLQYIAQKQRTVTMLVDDSFIWIVQAHKKKVLGRFE